MKRRRGFIGKRAIGLLLAVELLIEGPILTAIALRWLDATL